MQDQLNRPGGGFRYLTVREVADHYRVSRDTVIRWIKAGRISADNIGTPKIPRYRIRELHVGQMVVESHQVDTQDLVDYFN